MFFVALVATRSKLGEKTVGGIGTCYGQGKARKIRQLLHNLVVKTVIPTIVPLSSLPSSPRINPERELLVQSTFSSHLEHSLHRFSSANRALFVGIWEEERCERNDNVCRDQQSALKVVAPSVQN